MRNKACKGGIVVTVISTLYRVINQIINMKMNLFGYHISFMNIFAFGVITAICAVFIRNLLS